MKETVLLINEAIQDFNSLFIVSDNIPPYIRNSAELEPLNAEQAKKGIKHPLL